MRWQIVLVTFAGLTFVGCSGEQEYGTEGHQCYPNGTCNAGLSCHSDLCVFDEPHGDILDSFAVDEIIEDTQTVEVVDEIIEDTQTVEVDICPGDSQCISTGDPWCSGNYRHNCESQGVCLVDNQEYCDYGCSYGVCCPYNPDCSEEGIKWCSGNTRYYCVKQDGCLERQSEECNSGCAEGDCLSCQDLGGYCETGDDCCKGICDAEKYDASIAQNVCCMLPCLPT